MHGLTAASFAVKLLRCLRRPLPRRSSPHCALGNIPRERKKAERPFLKTGERRKQTKTPQPTVPPFYQGRTLTLPRHTHPGSRRTLRTPLPHPPAHARGQAAGDRPQSPGRRGARLPHARALSPPPYYQPGSNGPGGMETGGVCVSVPQPRQWRPPSQPPKPLLRCPVRHWPR